MLADTSIYPMLFCEYLKYWVADIGPWQERVLRVEGFWLWVMTIEQALRAPEEPVALPAGGRGALPAPQDDATTSDTALSST